MDKAKLFIIWLDGFLESSSPSLNISRTNAIKNKSFNLFEHVAEPVVEVVKPNLEELGKAHGFDVKTNGYIGFGGHGQDEDGNIYRC